MRAAMATAEVGDDVLDRDPTMRELEDRVAGLLGTDDALWTPSGSMGNLIALMSHLRRGDAFLAPAGAHVLDAELGTAAVARRRHAAAAAATPGRGRSRPRRSAARRARRGRTTRCAPRCCAWRTPTTRRAARSPPRTSTPPSPRPAAHLRVHLDGARLWHAAVALGVPPPATLAVGVDTVRCCFSKGLGAPVGSAVAGSAEFVQEARRLRKMLGGGVRQGGMLAAAALVGLDGMDRLADDHAKARKLAAGLRERGWSVGGAETNIVLVPVADLNGTLRRFADAGVLASSDGRARSAW